MKFYSRYKSKIISLSFLLEYYNSTLVISSSLFPTEYSSCILSEIIIICNIYLKSLYLNPPPNSFLLNTYLTLADSPVVADFTQYIEYHINKKYLFKKLCTRVNYSSTALGVPTFLEGLSLEIESKNRTGILSESSSVSLGIILI